MGVPLTEFRPNGAPTAAPEITFEDVRESFLIRLHHEESRLAALRVALETAHLDTVSSFIDLEIFAHRLRGAAAVFDLPEIRDAAKALELAAAAAAIAGASIAEPMVHDTIRDLSQRLARVNGFIRTASDPAMPGAAN